MVSIPLQLGLRLKAPGGRLTTDPRENWCNEGDMVSLGATSDRILGQHVMQNSVRRFRTGKLESLQRMSYAELRNARSGRGLRIRQKSIRHRDYVMMGEEIRESFGFVASLKFYLKNESSREKRRD